MPKRSLEFCSVERKNPGVGKSQEVEEWLSATEKHFLQVFWEGASRLMGGVSVLPLTEI